MVLSFVNLHILPFTKSRLLLLLRNVFIVCYVKTIRLIPLKLQTTLTEIYYKACPYHRQIQTIPLINMQKPHKSSCKIPN